MRVSHRGRIVAFARLSAICAETHVNRFILFAGKKRLSFLRDLLIARDELVLNR
jgi:hypothetical protein